MANKPIYVVVVTYNRKELLYKCLTNLLSIKNSDLNILIVDNASTDGTSEYISSLIGEKVYYHPLSKNVGGAGGFSYGIKKAVEMGAYYIWVMDDDCMASQSSLDALLNKANELNDNFGFLSSVVKWTDGSICNMNRQKVSTIKKVKDYTKTQKIKTASFVSILFTKNVVEEVGLPIKEFFIWGDDGEYTARISKKHDSYLVSDSIVVHHSQNNVGSNICSDSPDRLNRYFYAYRNEGYFYKKQGLKGKLYYALKIAYHRLKILLKSDNKKAKLDIIKKGLKASKTFNPKIEYAYNKNTTIKVLEFFGEPLSYGGQEAFMINMYSNFTNNQVEYTFCTPFHYDNAILKKLVEEKGDKVIYYDYPFNSKKRKKYIVEVAKKVISSSEYDVVHIQSGSVYNLLAVSKIAKQKGIKKVIVHSHAGGFGGLKYKLIKFFADRNLDKYADEFLACSEVAAISKFNKQILQNKEYKVIPNGIQTNNFAFNSEYRENLRKEFSIKDEILVCHVGRFSKEKNHAFIIDIIKELKKLNANFKVVCVGVGDLKDEFISKVNSLGLQENIILLGLRNDINKILMASDVFILPSFYEGLSVASIEAQATGICTICSEGVTKETKIIDNLCFLPIDNAKLWAEKIIEYSKQSVDRESANKTIINAGYDAKTSAKILEEIYTR